MLSQGHQAADWQARMGSGGTKGHTWALESDRWWERRPSPAAMALRELGPPASALQPQEGRNLAHCRGNWKVSDPEPSGRHDVLLSLMALRGQPLGHILTISLGPFQPNSCDPNGLQDVSLSSQSSRR